MSASALPYQRSLAEPVDKIQVAFEQFHEEHPEVYERLVRLARAQKRRNRKVGIKMLYERIRWSFFVRNYSNDALRPKLNNNYASRYARLIDDRETDLRGYFTFRRIAK